MHGSDQLDGPAIDVGQRRYERIVGFTIVVLVAVRLAVAATCPLAFDEAYYWRLSQNLAFGYIDHPPVVMALIHVGASLFGDTELGVRILNVLLGLPATWAVWRSATILFDREIGATAALYFNLTLVMAVGSIIFTPDSPLVLAAS